MAPCELAASKQAGRHSAGVCWWAAQAEGSAGKVDAARAAAGWDGGRLSAGAAGERVGAAALTVVWVTLSLPRRPYGSDGLVPFALEAIGASEVRWRSWGERSCSSRSTPWMARNRPGWPGDPYLGTSPTATNQPTLNYETFFKYFFFFLKSGKAPIKQIVQASARSHFQGSF